MTAPQTGRPLRQILGDDIAAYVAGALRIHLMARDLWNPDLDILDQAIPTAETQAVLQIADKATTQDHPTPPPTHHPDARTARYGRRS